MLTAKTNLVYLLLGVAVTYLQYVLWFDHGGVLDFWSLKQQLSLQLSSNAQLAQHNVVLAQQIVALQRDPEVMTGVARSKLGMIKAGEVFYQFLE